ncbi:putative reverse transcriptase domain-containing protein [Tanacetum coccineum]
MDVTHDACLEELKALMTLWDVKPRVEESSLKTPSVDELITQLRQMCEDAEDCASNAQEEARQKRKEALEEVVQQIYRTPQTRISVRLVLRSMHETSEVLKVLTLLDGALYLVERLYVRSVYPQNTANATPWSVSRPLCSFESGGNQIRGNPQNPQNNQRQNQGNPKGSNQASTSTQGGRRAPGRVYSLCAKAVVKDNNVVNELGSFDVIVGMDWMAEHRAEVVCYEKYIRVPYRNDMLIIQEEKSEISEGEIIEEGSVLLLETFGSISEDFQDYPDTPKLEFPLTELIPGAAPVARAPYRLAPAEMKELAEQLKELSDKGFIRPSSSPWGAPILFVKKKDGYFQMCIDYRVHDLMKPCGKPYLDKFMIVFINDILIYSRKEKEHEEHLKTILELLKKAKNLEAVKNWVSPTIPSEIRQFLGLAGEEHEEAFQLLKQKLCDVPILHTEGLDDFMKKIETEVDMKEIVARHRIPVLIISDHDSHFTLRVWQSLHEALGTQLNLSTAYHPRIRCVCVRRTIQTLEDMLRACVIDFGNGWDRHLPLVEFSYNNSYHTSIKVAPFEALYGRKCRSPVCWAEVGEA